MLIRQGFQYALRLKAQREALLRQWVGCRRFVFNEALAHQKSEVAAGHKRPGYVDLCARLPALKAQHPWLAEPPAYTSQECNVCHHVSADNRKSQAVFQCRGLWPHRARRPQRCEEHSGQGPAAVGLDRRNPAGRMPSEYPRTLRGNLRL